MVLPSAEDQDCLNSVVSRLSGHFKGGFGPVSLMLYSFMSSCLPAGGSPNHTEGLTPTTSASIAIEGEHCHRTAAARGLGTCP